MDLLEIIQSHYLTYGDKYFAAYVAVLSRSTIVYFSTSDKADLATIIRLRNSFSQNAIEDAMALSAEIKVIEEGRVSINPEVEEQDRLNGLVAQYRNTENGRYNFILARDEHGEPYWHQYTYAETKDKNTEN